MRFKGLTLIEVLVALVVLAVGFTIFGYFTTSSSLTRKAQYDTQSQAIARSFFDALRAAWNTNTVPFGSCPTSLIIPPSGYSVSNCTVTTPSGSNQLRQVQLSLVSPTGSSTTFLTQITLQPAL